MPNDTPPNDEEQPIIEKLLKKLAKRNDRMRTTSHSRSLKRHPSNNLAMYGGIPSAINSSPIEANYFYIPVPTEKRAEVLAKTPNPAKARKKQKRTKRGHTPLWYGNALIVLKNDPSLSNRAIAARVGFHVSNLSKEPHKSMWRRARKNVTGKYADTPDKDERQARKSFRYENADKDGD